MKQRKCIFGAEHSEMVQQKNKNINIGNSIIIADLTLKSELEVYGKYLWF